MNEISTETFLVVFIAFSFLANIFLLMILDHRVTKIESKLRNKYRTS